MMATEERKRAAGLRAAELVSDGMIVGLGTGSTARWLVERLGERVAEGLSILGVPTSERTAQQARDLGIPLGWLDEYPQLDLAIDGADEIDPEGQLIKGLGGALVREKLIAKAAAEFVIIADASKEVTRLGLECPVPVEIEPSSRERVESALRELGGNPVLRIATGEIYRTDNDNWIIDAHFAGIDDPVALEMQVNEIEGVIDNGLFTDLADRILIADERGVREWLTADRREEGA
jgi:ribose 5-phosphate isomerase A